VPLDYFQNNFLSHMPVIDKRLIGRKILGNLESLSGFGNVVTLASFQGFRNRTAEGSD
jgi:hypothetical protein